MNTPPVEGDSVRDGVDSGADMKSNVIAPLDTSTDGTKKQHSGRDATEDVAYGSNVPTSDPAPSRAEEVPLFASGNGVPLVVSAAAQRKALSVLYGNGGKEKDEERGETVALRPRGSAMTVAEKVGRPTRAEEVPLFSTGSGQPLVISREAHRNGASLLRRTNAASSANGVQHNAGIGGGKVDSANVEACPSGASLFTTASGKALPAPSAKGKAMAALLLGDMFADLKGSATSERGGDDGSESAAKMISSGLGLPTTSNASPRRLPPPLVLKSAPRSPVGRAASGVGSPVTGSVLPLTGTVAQPSTIYGQKPGAVSGKKRPARFTPPTVRSRPRGGATPRKRRTGAQRVATPYAASATLLRFCKDPLFVLSRCSRQFCGEEQQFTSCVTSGYHLSPRIAADHAGAMQLACEWVHRRAGNTCLCQGEYYCALKRAVQDGATGDEVEMVVSDRASSKHEDTRCVVEHMTRQWRQWQGPCDAASPCQGHVTTIPVEMLVGDTTSWLSKECGKTVDRDWVSFHIHRIVVTYGYAFVDVPQGATQVPFVCFLMHCLARRLHAEQKRRFLSPLRAYIEHDEQEHVKCLNVLVEEVALDIRCAGTATDDNKNAAPEHAAASNEWGGIVSDDSGAMWNRYCLDSCGIRVKGARSPAGVGKGSDSECGVKQGPSRGTSHVATPTRLSRFLQRADNSVRVSLVISDGWYCARVDVPLTDALAAIVCAGAIPCGSLISIFAPTVANEWPHARASLLERCSSSSSGPLLFGARSHPSLSIGMNRVWFRGWLPCCGGMGRCHGVQWSEWHAPKVKCDMDCGGRAAATPSGAAGQLGPPPCRPIGRLTLTKAPAVPILAPLDIAAQGGTVLATSTARAAADSFFCDDCRL